MVSWNSYGLKFRSVEVAVQGFRGLLGFSGGLQGLELCSLLRQPGQRLETAPYTRNLKIPTGEDLDPVSGLQGFKVYGSTALEPRDF